ncbi:hypothetical protein LPN04_00565 [Rugamonas sp. A1-17]|nr:hypothetical protein [Rugamonas sp. A1-17]
MQSISGKNPDGTGQPPGYLEVLREGMFALNPSGKNGFEGLVAEILTDACGRPFRLASSGSQGGRDGDDGSVYFEAKRYVGDLTRHTVSDKLLELGVRGVEHIALFVLATTCPVSAQHTEFYTRACDDIGIELLLLDWDESVSGRPALVVLLSLAGEVARQFFIKNLPERAQEIEVALSELETKVSNQIQAEMLAKLNNPLASLSHARMSNERWFKKIFTSAPDARRFLHQPVAYIAWQLAVGEPVNLCRALTVAGFRDECPQSQRLLEQYAGATGMIGGAHEAAWQAYQRNRWARHWFELMKNALSKEEFWMHSRLFLKIADVRYQRWSFGSDAASPFGRFFVTLHAELNDRLDKWSRSRREKLFGQKRPWWLN